MEPRKKIAIVGSAPIETDESTRIDSCDLVVRFNNCKVYGGNSGKKTDILCVNSGGIPVKMMIARKSIFQSQFYSLISEVWVPRVIKIHHDHMREINPQDPGLADEDLSAELIKSNKLDHLPVVRFSDEFNLRVFALLKQEARNPFRCPSTGFFAIQYVLDESRFANWDKLAFGFAFKGWNGHPFMAEKRIVLRYAQ
jgi:hypothetical protein